jgi:hypothetical protein
MPEVIAWFDECDDDDGLWINRRKSMEPSKTVDEVIAEMKADPDISMIFSEIEKATKRITVETYNNALDQKGLETITYLDPEDFVTGICRAIAEIGLKKAFQDDED